jgi:aspartate racemase
MQSIGLIGGMSWESSSEYYKIINELVRERLGGWHSARSVMVSVDFADIEILQREGRWQECDDMMVAAAQSLERAGAGCVVLATNTMHKSADAMQAAVNIPLLHIADATAERICAVGYHTVGLLGTSFTMEEDFYKGRLTRKYGLDVLVPSRPERDLVHRVIYDELCLGIIEEDSRETYEMIMANLVRDGAECIILGCTEIGLLVKPQDSPVPLFDTTLIHAEAAVDWALSH